MRAGQRRQRFHALERGQLVQQQAHLHAAARAPDQLIDHQLPGIVLVEDVGLQVDARGRGADQVDAREHRVRSLVEDHRIVARLTRRGFGQRARGEVAQRRGLCALVERRAVHVRRARGGDDARTFRALLGDRLAQAARASTHAAARSAASPSWRSAVARSRSRRLVLQADAQAEVDVVGERPAPAFEAIVRPQHVALDQTSQSRAGRAHSLGASTKTSRRLTPCMLRVPWSGPPPRTSSPA
jgi:hypothetical protein